MMLALLADTISKNAAHMPAKGFHEHLRHHRPHHDRAIQQHTAGAVRIAAMSRALLGQELVKANVVLYGSFAQTGEGHGTRLALLGDGSDI